MKKDRTRFTIRFNPADPRHMRTVAALEKAGRRKASLIVEAVCEYLARHGGNKTDNTLLPAQLPAIALQTDSQDANPVHCRADMAYQTDIGEITEDSLINPDLDVDLQEAVMNGLQNFKF